MSNSLDDSTAFLLCVGRDFYWLETSANFLPLLLNFREGPRSVVWLRNIFLVLSSDITLGLLKS